METKPFIFERPTGQSTQVSTKQWGIPDCSEHQNTVVSHMLNSDAPIVRLTGSPGTGKTFTTSALITYFIRNKVSIALTGTTHASVAVLTNMVPEQYRKHTITATIHSYLSMRLVQDGANGEKLQRLPNAKPKPAVDYLFVDEVSMLTSELMVYLKQAKVRKKIILVGDAVQLTLPGSANLDRYPEFELTVNMRQDDTRTDLKTLLSTYRDMISGNIKSLPTLPISSANITVHEDHCTFLKAYKQSTYTSKVIACFMNKTVKTYNTNVKKYVLETDELYTIGDIVYPTSPAIVDGNIVIPNRALCVIQDVMDCDDYYSLLTNKGVLDVPKVKTTFNGHLQALADERNWKEMYAIKDQFTHVHHCYAGTAHSLQGTTVDEVFVDMPDLMQILHTSNINQFLRALYVATSRASKQVHLYIGNKREYECLGTKVPRRLKEQT